MVSDLALMGTDAGRMYVCITDARASCGGRRKLSSMVYHIFLVMVLRNKITILLTSLVGPYQKRFGSWINIDICWAIYLT